MTTLLRVKVASDWQDVAAGDLPFAVGIIDDGAVLFGAAAELSAVAWLGHDAGRIFLQPADGAGSVRLNDGKLDESAWLAAGDRIAVGRESITVAIDAGVMMLAVDAAKTANLNQATTPPPIEKTDDLDLPSGSGDFSVGPIGPIRGGRRQSRGRNALIALFVALLAAVTFVVVASPVRITVSPEPDALSVDGSLPPIPFAGHYLALPGNYSVVAEKEGYRKLEQGITVSFGQDALFDYEMTKLPGYLDVTSIPVADARVEIDGEEVGVTPLERLEIEAGQHSLRVTAERYLPFEDSIEITGMGLGQRAEITLQPAWGTLILASEPSGAVVVLDGEEIGSTPLRAELLNGSYSIELRKTGWKPAQLDVAMAAGEKVEPPPVRLEKADALVELTTSPAGANVTVDEQYRGQTPMTLTLSPNRDHKLTVSKAGFAAATRTVRPGEGGKESLHIDLKPQYGIVFVITRPAGATLKVDGKSQGSASQRLRLTTAPHRIEITKPGYAAFSTTVTPSSGESKRVEVRLEKIGEASQSASAVPEPTVKAAAGALRLIKIADPARFKVGASRREAGRRSNETLHSVELTRSFYIGEKEVTNAEFRRFDAQHDSGSERGVDLSGPDMPVVSVSWDDAARYMNWLSQQDGLSPVYVEKNGIMVAKLPIADGYRLPTEAEWVYAARYEGGRLSQDQALKYPWGVGLPPPPNSGNYADRTAAAQLPLTISGYSDGALFAAPVGNYAPNKTGLYDLGGNVAEWCHDYYDVYTGNDNRVLTDPTGPATGKFHVVRGSSWRHGSVTELRLSYRDYALKPRNDLGLRVARYAAGTPN